MLGPVEFFDLWPGQRVEVLVSFADLAVGSSAVLRSVNFPIVAPAVGPAGPRQGDPLDIMTFHVDHAGGASTPPPPPPAPALVDSSLAVRTRTFNLGVMNGQHTINGQIYDLDRIDFHVPAGEIEIWEFVNQTANFHPMHVHGVFFRVLESSDDLQAWISENNPPVIANGLLEWRQAAGASRRFYRLALP